MVELHWGMGSSAGVFLLLIAEEFIEGFTLAAGELPEVFLSAVGELPPGVLVLAAGELPPGVLVPLLGNFLLLLRIFLYLLGRINDRG